MAMFNVYDFPKMRGGVLRLFGIFSENLYKILPIIRLGEI